MRKKTVYLNNLRPTPFSAKSLIGNLLNDLDSSSTRTRKSQLQNADIYEKDEKLNYELELPGFSKEDIQVKTRDNKLLITGEKDEEKINKNRNYLSRNRAHSKVQRSFPLPEGIESAKELDAEFNNGVLHIVAPLSRKEEQETVEVEIK